MSNAAKEYKRLVRELLVKRAIYAIDQAEERRYTGMLDEQWSQMDPEEHEQVDTWVREQVTATPLPAEVREELPVVESDDLTEAARTAA